MENGRGSDPPYSVHRIDSLKLDAITHLEQSANRERAFWTRQYGRDYNYARFDCLAYLLTQDPIWIGQRHLLFAPHPPLR